MKKTIASVSIIALSLLMGVASGANMESAAYASTEPAAVAKAPFATGRGPLRVVGAALGEVTLTAAQHTEIEKLFKDAEARHAKAKEASRGPRREVLLGLAAQVEKGSVDRSALEPQITASEAPWAGVRQADHAAVEQVRALLDASQRRQLAAALEKSHAGKNGAHHGRGWKPFGRMIHRAEVSAPNLTPEQRVIAAAKLRARASKVE